MTTTTNILMRSLAAIFGGYALASATTLFLSAVLPMAKTEAVITASLFSFVLYTFAVIWVFAQPGVSRAWLGMLVPSIVLFVLSLWLSGGML